MQEFNVARILELVRRLSLLDGLRISNATNSATHDQEIDFRKLDMKPFLANLNELRGFLLETELFASKGYVDRIEAMMMKPTYLSSFTAEYDKLHSTIHVEIGQKHFLRLSESEKALFQPNSPIFGDDVQEKFLFTAYEIDEAAKCLALGRATAVVFHLMRAVESTLIALRCCLGLPPITDPRERSWGLFLKSLRAEVDRRNNKKEKEKEKDSPGWSNLEDQHLFTGLIGTVAAIKLAWRDPTMHVESKYDLDEAHQIFAAIRTLMQKVASRMDENGMPMA